MITIRQWQSDSPKSVASRLLWYGDLNNDQTFYTCHDQSGINGNDRIK